MQTKTNSRVDFLEKDIRELKEEIKEMRNTLDRKQGERDKRNLAIYLTLVSLLGAFAVILVEFLLNRL